MTTPDRRILPAAQAQLVDKNGRATPALYDFMRRVTGATEVIPTNISQASFITVTDESDVLHNSMHLAAGANITITQSENALLINAVIDPNATDGYPLELGHAGI